MRVGNSLIPFGRSCGLNLCGVELGEIFVFVIVGLVRPQVVDHRLEELLGLFLDSRRHHNRGRAKGV